MRKSVFIVILPLLILTGCFTGVESTPRISGADVRRETKNGVTIADVDERELAADITAKPPALWRKGDAFIVADPKISLTFPSVPTNELPRTGDTIYFAGISDYVSVLGEEMARLNFITERGDTLSYRSDLTHSVLNERKNFDVPFLIQLGLVEKADSILRGKEVYIRTSFQYSTQSDRRTEAPRFRKAVIRKVETGSTELPLKVIFGLTDNPKQNDYYLLMAEGSRSSSTRNFPSLFALRSPRSFYPHITDEVWEAITLSKVIPGMTRDECRLALGSPAEVIHGHSYSSVYERWIYTDGRNLLFEDGLLKSTR